MGLLSDIDLVRELRRSPPPRAAALRPRLAALRDEALALVQSEALATPRAIWRFAALDAAPDVEGTLRIEGRRLDAPRLVPVSGRLTAVACAVCTLGPALERRVALLFAERRASLAVALDGVGNELLFALSRRTQDRMLAQARRQRLSVAGELRAGDPGLALQAQRTVLDLAGAWAIGVELTSALMMHPVKSTSVLQGVGVDLPRQAWSRCDECRSRARCALVAEAAA
ncbi:MAG: hypothetical protein ABS84_00400 [Rubrivivax sp. SCN 71-131]|jgi:hypothetical protein|nr:MAG: hypothetical protein ABS84_00400 [Rubrivivax sp. SCN 71-131]